MNGPVALVGGAEHTAGCEPADRLLLRACGVRRPAVAVLLAASPDRRRAFKRAEAEGWWSRLGAHPRCAFAGEANPLEQAAALIAHADLIVLTGGRPWLLWRRLLDTPLGERVHDRWRQGVPVSGSSAGAMVLAASAWSLRPAAPLTPCPGLGLVPDLLVAPHAGRHGVDRWARRTQSAHPDLEVVGIPDRTTLLVQPGGERTVLGAGRLVGYGVALPGHVAAALRPSA